MLKHFHSYGSSDYNFLYFKKISISGRIKILENNIARTLNPWGKLKLHNLLRTTNFFIKKNITNYFNKDHLDQISIKPGSNFSTMILTTIIFSPHL